MGTRSAPMSPLGAAIEALEIYLAFAALGDVSAREILPGFAERARASGFTLARVYAAWRRLDPVIASSSIVWTRDEGALEEHWTHEDGPNSPEFLASPIHYLLTADVDFYRCRLAGANEPYRFPSLAAFAADGLTDYVIVRVGFGADTQMKRPGGGVMLSFASDAPGGFSDDEMDALNRIKYMLALTIRSTLQADIGRSLAHTYLPRTAGDRVLDGEILLGHGDTIDAVVWYCDLRGSTALCDRLGTERYLPFLNDFFAATAKPVVEHGGDVLDYIGDAVLAIFPGADGVARALRATNCVRERLGALRARHSDAIGDRHDLAELIGVAIDIGRVVYGNIGINERMTFSAIGGTVNRVVRIERLTKSYGVPILVTDAVARQAGEGWMSVGRPELAGIANPPELFACR
ncbi:adenylate/guanylate cyclase domain-containing protein [Acuticoccus sp. I52.16.1]|uniref:adenylate/guanylate cyclase domain-containing protein n=1 Tax=Acuticoccus sp. I52.16.1 TaxID=2928472 RepID=UPI001FD124A4|nr:adenylate/guanylate cyclase domain-containing protein [Acuticoccus sp. I52.16.1]UOM33217.1 adenylate/guanylate cyclase domain-containing protein [Acuticoccus sp. I52.16.1]